MDLFSTNVLMGVVRSLFAAPSFLLDRYFGTVQTENSEEIHFDVMDGARRVSPFCSPLVEGQIVESLGWTVVTFKPPYIKDKRVFDMNRPYKRSAGEAIGGALTPQARMRAILAFDTQDQLDMLTRRQELMAAEALQTAKLTIEGDKYPRVVLDFKRDVALVDVAVTPTWDQPAATPLSDLESLSLAMLSKNGVAGTDVIMGATAWKWFRSNAQVTDRLSLYRTFTDQPTIADRTMSAEGGQMMGMIDNFNIIVYAGWYVDPMDGALKEIWNPKRVVVTSTALDGVRCYGAIKDDDILNAVPYYVKSWVQPDPSVRFLMMQSAPIPVPTRVNAAASALVLP